MCRLSLTIVIILTVSGFVLAQPAPAQLPARAIEPAPPVEEPVAPEAPDVEAGPEAEAIDEVAGDTEEPPADAPDEDATPDPVPNSILVRLEALSNPARMTPRPTSQEEFRERFTEQQVTTIAVGQEAIASYPDAENLDSVRNFLVDSAMTLYRIDPTDEHKTQLTDVCTETLNNATNINTKLNADLTQTFVALPDLPAEDAEAALEDLLTRYEGTDAAGDANIVVLMLADDLEFADLADQCATTLETDYLDQDGVAVALFRMGRTVPFEITLTTLDGETLTLPDDLEGKVVIIDVWTSWCGYCTQLKPHLEAMVNRHAEEGLVVVGVSMDQTKDEAVKHLESETNDWIQTYDGPQPNAFGNKFEVGGYPTLFVIDREGNLAAIDPQDMRHYPDYDQVMKPFEELVIELLGTEEDDVESGDAPTVHEAMVEAAIDAAEEAIEDMPGEMEKIELVPTVDEEGETTLEIVDPDRPDE